MNHHNFNHRKHASLDYQQLESRQLLTSIAYYPSYSVDLPQDGSKTVLANLDEAPNIVEQPEHGELIFDEVEGTLTYHPDKGFVGDDSFQLASNGQTTTTDVRVWQSTYAVPDWAIVKPGESISVAALDNDYTFRDVYENTSYGGWSERFAWKQDSSDFRIVSFTSSSGAVVTISEDGKLLNYTPEDGFTGEDIVTYTLENSAGHRSEATITIEVSNQDASGRYFISEAQLQQKQIEDWMERYAPSLTSSRIFNPIVIDGIQGIAWGRTVNFAQTANFSADRLADVQEGDIVKSHENLLYYVTHDDGSGDFASYLSIVDLSDPTNPQVVSTTGFDHTIRDIFLDDGRVAVVMDGNGYARNPWIISQFSYSQQRSFEVLVMDVTETSTPTEVYRATIDGSYTDARLVGDELYVISANRNTAPSPWQLRSDGLVENATSPGNFIDAILEHHPNFGIPTITVDSNGTTETISAGHDQVVRRDDTYSSTLITTFNIQDNSGQPVDIDLIQTNSVNTVYVSDQSIYLFDGASVIKLDLLKQNPGVEFSADGQLAGRLISQFAANEYQGHLRVAINSRAGSSDVLVFKQVDETLVVTSSLEDIAPGEQVYSARFELDKAFIVTFRRIDPLFVVDLADPNDAKIAGELKIPGVSNYLQWIGDGLLLAVGRDANPTTGRFGALQISLFDVSDSNDPQLLDRYTFDGGIKTSTPLIRSMNAAPEHHALTFDSSTGTLALPIFTSGVWQNIGDQTVQTDLESSISLFKVDRDSGIQFTNEVEFDSKALRTVVVGDHLVYLSEEGLKTASRLTPHEIIASMPLPADDAQQLAARPITPETELTIPFEQILIADTSALLQRQANFVAPSFLSRLSSISEPQFVTNADWNDNADVDSRDTMKLSGAIDASVNAAATSDSSTDVESNDASRDDSTLDRFFAEFEDSGEENWSDSKFEKAG